MNKTGNAAATYALDASGSAALVGISGLTLGGSVEIRKNTTGAEVKQTTIATPGDDVTFSFSSSEGSLQSVGGGLTLDVSGFVSVSGNFGFQKTSETTAGVTTSRLLVGVSELNAFFGDAGPEDQRDHGRRYHHEHPGGRQQIECLLRRRRPDRQRNDDTGVRVTDGTLGLLVNKTGNAASTYALYASGRGPNRRRADLTLGGTLAVQEHHRQDGGPDD